VVEADTSDVRVGAVLSQRSALDLKLHPCTFFSHHLNAITPRLPHSPLSSVSRPTPPPSVINGHLAYTVRRLLSVRPQGRGFQYLVVWEGYGPEERCWIPARDILDPARITDYHRLHPGQPGMRPGRTPGGAPRGEGTVTP
jgi:hypothetical protein